MEQDYISEGLKQLLNDETESTYYYSDEMLADGLLIEESTLIYDEKDGKSRVETMVSIKYINKIAGIDLDAVDYTMYWGELLAPIQTYRIVKDIYDLYTTLSLRKFIEVMRELSTSYYSSSMQSKLEHSEHIRNDIQEVFDYVDNTIQN